MFKAMLVVLLKYVVGPFVGAVIGKALLEVCHAFDWWPDKLVAGFIMTAATEADINLVGWLLSAAMGISLYAVAYYFLFTQRHTAKKGGKEMVKPGDTINITSHEQKGGITAHTVNIGPRKLRFSEEIGKQIVGKISRDKPMTLQSVGSDADQQVADEFQAFFANNGFKISRHRIGVMAPPPDHPIEMRESEKEVILIIAPSA